MKTLLIKFCTWYLAREYRIRAVKKLNKHVVFNQGRNRDERDIAAEFGVPLSVARRILKK